MGGEFTLIAQIVDSPPGYQWFMGQIRGRTDVVALLNRSGGFDTIPVIMGYFGVTGYFPHGYDVYPD